MALVRWKKAWRLYIYSDCENVKLRRAQQEKFLGSLFIVKDTTANNNNRNSLKYFFCWLIAFQKEKKNKKVIIRVGYLCDSSLNTVKTKIVYLHLDFQKNNINTAFINRLSLVIFTRILNYP